MIQKIFETGRRCCARERSFCFPAPCIPHGTRRISAWPPFLRQTSRCLFRSTARRSTTPANAGARRGCLRFLRADDQRTDGRVCAALYDLGLGATIGKGNRSAAVVDAIRRNRAVYLVAIGGAGAIAARHITSLEEIAFPELGCESVKRLTFCDFPLVVGIDCAGNNVYEFGKD